MKNKKIEKKADIKVRDILAAETFNRSGQGHHGDAKKEKARKVCRERVRHEE